MTTNSQGTVDPLDFSAVIEAPSGAQPRVTLYIPTDVTGANAELSSLSLKNTLREAHAGLVDSGLSHDAAEAVLAPASELVADSSFWRLQSRGLVIFASQDLHLAVRVPIQVSERVSVGDNFDILPLAPVLASDRKLYIFALSKGSVRLFNATRNTIEELPLENVPASFDDVIDELPEREVDGRSAGPGVNTPYSHGHESDVNSALLEKYIHEVGTELGKRLGTARSQPLVLASVAEYLPIFTRSCPYPVIFDRVIAGNPEHTLPDDLRSAAWRLIGDSENAHDAEEQDRARSLAHHGKGAFDLAEIAKAAGEGRVETLYVSRDDQALASPDERDLANQAMLGTLRNSGSVRTLSAIDGAAGAIAVFRY